MMTRRISAVCVVLVLLSGCSPAQTPETATLTDTEPESFVTAEGIIPVLTREQLDAGGFRPITELERLHQLKAIEDLRVAETLWASLEKAVTINRLGCMMAVGSEPFCNCFANEMSPLVSFADYASITMTPRVALGYADLDADRKTLVDTVLAARETCVASAFR